MIHIAFIRCEKDPERVERMEVASELQIYKEAWVGANAELWRKAMNDKFATLLEKVKRGRLRSYLTVQGVSQEVGVQNKAGCEWKH